MRQREYELTGWFPLGQPPTEPGVYELGYLRKPTWPWGSYSYWDGKKWYATGIEPDHAQRYYRHRTLRSLSEVYHYWRGVTTLPLDVQVKGKVVSNPAKEIVNGIIIKRSNSRCN